MFSLQHKTRCLVSTTKGTKHLAGEVQSVSDLDFYIDGVGVAVGVVYVCRCTLEYHSCIDNALWFASQEMLHIADTKMARRYGDFFIRQIHKLEEVGW